MDNAAAINSGEGGQDAPRERRSRDRYGRDRGGRGERQARPPRDDAAEAGTSRGNDGDRANGEEVSFNQDAARPVRDAASANVASPVTASAPNSTPAKQALPRVQAFKLPMTALEEVAQSSGLQWVNSDADKVAAVQAAIAAEPKPVHVPRERPAPVVIDEGPLVLVETRRDLREMEVPKA